MSESTYKRDGSRVYGNGQSYNCLNIVTATQLCETLNQYEEITQLHYNLDKQYDNITKQLIQIKLSIGTLTEEIHKLEEDINAISDR